MATVSLASGSKFIGCPVVFNVTPGSVPAGATFHRVRVVVTVNGQAFVFSTPVSGSGSIPIDISSALRAVADNHNFSADGLSYPGFGNASGDKIEAYDDYLVNGVENHSAVSTGTLSGPYYIGRLTDRERLTNERPTYYSRKPYRSSPEIVHVGKTLVIPGAYSAGPNATTMNITANTAPANIHGESVAVSYYPIAAPKDSYELRFINTLGVHESLHVTCLRQTEVNIKNDFYSIARLETLTQFSRGVAVKQNDYEQWKMSSGPLDRAWQQYYLHEPLMAKWAWLKVDGQWLPVHIVPGDTTKGIDRSKGDALTVEFTIRFDINGSPFV